MSKRDYYEVLGVDRGAEDGAIKAAYRKLAMKYHPDRNNGDPEAEHQFKEINEAYDVLKDPEKRAAYDRFGHAAFDGAAGFGGRRGPGFGDFSGSFADVFDEFFGDFMGGRARQSRAARGADLRYNMEITLEEAYTGKDAQIRVPSAVTCDTCEGTGAEPGTKPEVCPTCSGLGRVRAQQGFFTIERTCPHCGGRGRVVKTPCRACSGAGRLEKERTLQVTIPPGVEDGTRIRLAGEGDVGPQNGPRGDLYIFLSLRPHTIFEREGPHLLLRLPVSITQAALGGEVEVPTLSGSRARVRIPEGTQPGRHLRLRGKGMPILRSTQHGDLHIEAVVEVPTRLSSRQKDLLREFESELETGSHEPERTGFLARVKKFLEELGTG